MLKEKISVVVIAHNEAGNIARCLESIRRQTLKPDEVILVAHNCTDRTVEIAKRFWSSQNDEQIRRIIEYNGPAGIVFARIRGFEEASNEYIACIDGDSYALTKTWLWKLISRLHRRKNPAVGGGVWLRGGLIPSLMSLDFFWLKPIYKFILHLFPNHNDGWSGNYFWGVNFAIRKSVYEKVGGLIPFIRICEEIYQQDLQAKIASSHTSRNDGKIILDPSTSLRTTVSNINERRLGLSLAPEDLYLAKKVSEVGRVEIEPWAVVVSYATKTNWKIRTRDQGADRKKLINYLNTHQNLT